MPETKHNDTLSLMEKRMNLINEKCTWIESEGKRIKTMFPCIYNNKEHKVINNGIIDDKNATPIFITARFRSGSTFLWNFFRQISNATAYYEPLHENLLQHIGRQTPVQGSHIGVQSYWIEYAHIASDLINRHNKEFGFRKLLLEESDDYPELAKYILFLIKSTKDACPILQFNRVDFRLPWLRKRFPEAKIIHLWRNPRDQWYSMVKSCLSQNVISPDINTNYDILLWSIYLSKDFPFLVDSIQSSYERHYYIWRLSNIMGTRCSDISIDYDNEIQLSPEIALNKIKQTIGISGHERDFISNISPVETGKWETIRPADWFEETENRCDRKLTKLGLVDLFGIKPLKEIIDICAPYWQELNPEGSEQLIQQVISLYLSSRGETATFINSVNDNLNIIVEASNEVGDNSKKIVDLYLAETNRASSHNTKNKKI